MSEPELIRIIRFYPNDEAMVRITQLTQYGVVVDKTDRSGRTALIWAVVKGNVPMVKRLLRLGADPKHEDKRGRAVTWYVRKKAPEDVRSDLAALLDLDRSEDDTKDGARSASESDARRHKTESSPPFRKSPYEPHIDIPKKPELIDPDRPPYWEVD